MGNIKKNTLYKQFIKGDIELTYSFLHFVSGNPVWFCRIWEGFYCHESYGKTKFEAYRLAKKDWQQSLCLY